MVTLLFALAAYGSPVQGEPDLAFKNTSLIAPRCTVGQAQTWDITSTTLGRTHGRHVNTGVVIDRDIRSSWDRTVTLTCTDNDPARLQLRMALSGEDAGFTLHIRLKDRSDFEVVEISADDAAGLKAAETWRIGTNLRSVLSWLFPPMAADVPNPGDHWDGAWPLEMGPWWDCHGLVTAGVAKSNLRDYTLAGRCEQISYNGHTRLSGTFSRIDGGFGVTKASWKAVSSWEHYYIFTDTEQAVTVTLR